MKRIYTISAFVSVLLPLALSCTKTEGLKEGNVELSADVVTIGADAGLGILEVDSSADWYIENIPDWCGTVRPSGGEAGKTTVRIRGRFYYETRDRSAVVSVVCGGVSKQFTLIQTGMRSITITPLFDESISSDGGPCALKIESSFPYEVSFEQQQDWLEISSSDRPVDGILRLNASVNPEADRSAVLMFSDPQSSYIQKFKITQAGDAAYQDRASLIEFYNSTEGSSWTRSDGWCTDAPVDTWWGVTTRTVNGKTRVVSLSLGDNNIKGSVPESFGRLSCLESLVLKDNCMSGSIPLAVRQMASWSSFDASTNIYPQQSGYGFSYFDGETFIWNRSTKSNPINVVILGDGFDLEGLKYGGRFDQLVQEAMDGLFGTEPMASFKDYFTVTSVAALSEETGTGVLAARNTAFGTYFVDNVSVTMNANDSEVYRYVAKAGVTDYPATLVIVLIDWPDRLGGVTLSYKDGRTMSICTNGTPGNMYGLKGLMRHEVVGHTLAKLDEEYWPGTRVLQTYLNSLPVEQAQGKALNVSSSSDLSQVPWKHFIGVKGYESVGAYLIYDDRNDPSKGLWKPEPLSVMVNNNDHFNAPSRELIVKKIKELCGETYSFEEFIANDRLRGSH